MNCILFSSKIVIGFLLLFWILYHILFYFFQGDRFLYEYFPPDVLSYNESVPELDLQAIGLRRSYKTQVSDVYTPMNFYMLFADDKICLDELTHNMR